MRCLALLALVLGSPVSASAAAATAACTLFASPAGSGTACSRAAPCPLHAGVRKLAPGATLCLRGGTYSSFLSWTELSGPKGSDERHRVTVRAHPGETAVLMPVTSGGRDRPAAVVQLRCHSPGIPLALDGPCQYGRCSDRCPRYLTIGSDPADGSRLVLDARHTSGSLAAGVWVQPSWNPGNAHATGPHHVRLQGLEIRNSPSHGIYWGAGDYNELVDLDVHDNGTPLPGVDVHGLYLTSMKNTVLRGSYHHNRDSGIHVWNGGESREASYNTFREVEVHGNGCTVARAASNHCSPGSPPAVGTGSGRHNTFHGLRVHHNLHGGFWIANGSWYTTIRDCTVTDNALSSKWKVSGIYLGDEAYLRVKAPYEPALQAVERLTSWEGSHLTTVSGNKLSGNGNVGRWEGRTGLCSYQIYVADPDQNPPSRITGNTCSR